MSEILRGLGDECNALGAFAEQFQAALGPVLFQLAGDPECHRQVQLLDLLSQRLAALSAYALAIGHTVPAEWRVNTQPALRHVPLAGMAARLRGVPAPDSQPGTAEWF